MVYVYRFHYLIPYQNDDLILWVEICEKPNLFIRFYIFRKFFPFFKTIICY